MKYLQCSKPFHSNVFIGFQQQDSQSTYSFGKIENVGVLELSEEKIGKVFRWEKIPYFNFTYMKCGILAQFGLTSVFA